eukprot:GEMP01035745.1.p1 GENE.GEMP01035745.1~~GEMP01035745.1.p1  ORF type:complete len:479 (+),score=103.76 GEMP01035745.1:22-1437(+)
MQKEHFGLLQGLLTESYSQQAEQARNSRTKLITNLLSHRKLPQKGWTDHDIRIFLEELASSDANNALGNVGAGEREGRVLNRLVYDRHFGLAHGIGRSGDVMAQQPKAPGSSLIVQLTKYLALDAIQLSGLKAAKSCVVLPVATGMAMAMVFLTMRQKNPSAKYIVWSRIDQKSCFKAIGMANMQPVVVPLLRVGDALVTDVEAIEKHCKELGKEVLCVCTTTSTFAPRVPDLVDEVANVCKKYDVPHVVNNAYGLQCSKIMHSIETAMRKGRLDAVVQSTDKNFLVPVGGAIVCGTDDIVDGLSKLYPGRASIDPILDLFITLLGLGQNGLKALWAERKNNVNWFGDELKSLAAKHNCRVLETPANKISFALALPDFECDWSYLGSMLFSRRVSGPRVVKCPTAAKTIDGVSFPNYGSHNDDFELPYLTAACAVGSTRTDLETFLQRLDQALTDIKAEFGSKNAKDAVKE